MKEELPMNGTSENKNEKPTTPSDDTNNSVDKGDANIANVAKAGSIEDDKENYEFIPQSVYKALPKLLKDSSEVFQIRREKDVYLTGAIGVLGGCFHNLYAFNDVDKTKVSTNLYMYVVAPPANGKGTLKYAKSIALQIKETYEAKNKTLKEKKHQHLFIPANISSAGLMQMLKENKGVGVMIESEIDTLVTANKQDWGNFSDILRKGYENETASLSRKKDKEYVEIENVKMSLAISGTPNQFKNLMHSVENGLFSRGCYYSFENEIEELKCYGRLNTSVDVVEYFKGFAKTANDYYKSHIRLDEIKVVFSEGQLKLIQDDLQKSSDLLVKFQELQPNIRRSFIATQKIAAILTYLFACENGQVSGLINCTDKALLISIRLASTYLAHSLRVYSLLPQVEPAGFTNNQQRLLADLPDEFTRAEAVEKGEVLTLSPRTVDTFLKMFKDLGKIELLKAGKYKKK